MTRIFSNVFPVTVSGLPLFVPSPGFFADVSAPSGIGSTMASVNPCPQNNCIYSPAEGQSGVFDWCGGGYVAEVGTAGYLVMTGGGHNGYYGNEVYVFDFGTQRWSVKKLPGLYNQNDDGFQGGLLLASRTLGFLPGCIVYTYAPGTTTPQAVYADEACTVPHPNPFTLGSVYSEVPFSEVWTPAGVRYKWVVANSGDTNPPTNPIPAVGAPNNRMLSPWMEYDPGEPAAAHTYRHTFGLPPSLGGGPQGSLVMVGMTAAGGSALPSGFNPKHSSHRFDIATEKWSRYSNTYGPQFAGQAPVAMDSVHGKFYAGVSPQGSFGSQIMVFDCFTRNWTQSICPTPGQGFSAHPPMDYCPALDCLVLIDTSLGGTPSDPGVWTTPCSNLPQGWSKRTTNTMPRPFAIYEPTMNWAPLLGKFGFYGAMGTDYVHYLKAPATINGTWEWSTETFASTAGATPANGSSDPNGAATQCFNRFNWVEPLKSWAWYAQVNTPVQLWRPAEAV